jgi:membrane protein
MTTPFRTRFAGRYSLRLWADRPLAEPSLLYGPLHFLARLVLITITEFNRNSLSLRSGAMTYTVLLSLVPILALSTAVVKGLGGGDQLRKAASTYVESLEESASLFPKDLIVEQIPNSPGESGATLTDHLRSAIDQLFDYVDKTDFAAIGTFGVLGILLSVILLLSNIESAMNTIWKVPDGRSLLRKIADYLTLLILMPLSINVAFAASAFLKNPTLASHVDVFIPFPWMQALLLNALPVVFIAVTFYVMYLFFPNTRVRTRPAVLGAVLAAVLWFGVQNIYISLQIGVSRYNAIYGSFATLPLFLVWIYLGWIFILTGAQVAYAAQHVKEYRIVPLAVTPALRLSLAFDIMDRVYYNFIEAQPTTKDNLTDFLSAYPAHLVAEVIAVLEKSGIVHISQSSERLLPGSPLERYGTKDVVDSILGAEVPDTAGGRMSREAIAAAAAAASRKRNEENSDM